jgi:hypothetical protein
VKWFMSFARVYGSSKLALGHCVYAAEEHPIARAQRITADDGAKHGYKVVVLSFQQVPLSVADCEVVGVAIG